MTVKDTTIKLLNTAYEKGLLDTVFSGIVSADTFKNVEACNKSIELLYSFIDALPETNIDNKEKWERSFKDAVEVALLYKMVYENGIRKAD